MASSELHPQALPEWLEYVEHTADTGIRVWGPDAAAVLSRAAWGLFSLLVDPATVQARLEEQIEVRAEPGVPLLAAWLSALNLRHQVEHRLYCRFEILSLSPDRLTARLGGEAYDPSRHDLRTEIKAVTLCGLEFGPVGDRWVGQAIVDV